MATDLRSLVPYNSTDAQFRAWGSGLAAQIAAVGLVQHTDTGQINWVTVTRPLAVSTAMGYEIWRSNDGLANYYIKIEYGSGTATLAPGLWITIGTGTNGAGTITGQVGSRVQVSGASGSAAATPCYASGSSSRLSLVSFHGGGIINWNICIERSRDSSGAETADFIWFFMTGSPVTGIASASQIIPYSGTVYPYAFSHSTTNANGAGRAPCWLPNLSTLIESSVIKTFPHYPVNVKGWNPACLSFVTYFIADIAATTTFTMSIYGVTRTYIALPVLYVATTNIGGVSLNAGLAMLWE